MYQSIMTKTKNSVSENWVADCKAIIKHRLKFFSVSISKNNSLEKCR